MPEPENRLASDMASRLVRITLLRRVSETVGQEALAQAMSIEPRSLRAKLSANRGVSNDDLRLAASALEAHSARVASLAQKISAALGGPQPSPSIGDDA